LLSALAELTLATEPARLAGQLLGKVGLRLQAEGQPGSEAFIDRLEAVARQSLGEDVDFLHVLAAFADGQLRLGRYDKARGLAAEVLGSLARLGIREHWLLLWAERIRGLALALGAEPAAGEEALIQLARRVDPLPQGASEPARAAAGVLGELCTRLQAANRLDAFLAESLRRWQAGEPTRTPWWPADADGVQAAVLAAARTAVEREIASPASPRLQQVIGALLLREDRTEAAARALESAFSALQPPPPELLADLAIARGRLGDSRGAADLVAALRASPATDPDMQARRDRALVRAGAGR
jgi:hypothetical protein